MVLVDYDGIKEGYIERVIYLWTLMSVCWLVGWLVRRRSVGWSVIHDILVTLSEHLSLLQVSARLRHKKSIYLYRIQPQKIPHCPNPCWLDGPWSREQGILSFLAFSWLINERCVHLSNFFLINNKQQQQQQQEQQQEGHLTPRLTDKMRRHRISVAISVAGLSSRKSIKLDMIKRQTTTWRTRP